MPNDNLLEKALALFLLKTKEVRKVSQSALDGIVEDMGLFIENLVSKITSELRFTMTNDVYESIIKKYSSATIFHR